MLKNSPPPPPLSPATKFHQVAKRLAPMDAIWHTPMVPYGTLHWCHMATGTLGVCHYGGTWCPSVAGDEGEFFASDVHGHNVGLLRVLAQDALDRYWYPSLMMFGPSDKESVHSSQSMKWRIKINSNDELRQKFVDQTVPQAEYLGLTVPDENLRLNSETGHYEFSEPDWTEFFEVLNGNGPCNTERLNARNKAWDDGKWVRDGMLEHARKKAARVAASKVAAE